MTKLIRVGCPVCDGKGEIEDERGVVVVCHGCVGQGYHYENPHAPACDVESHQEVEV